MRWLVTGCGEVIRKLTRSWLLWCHWRTGRKLRAAEIRLGWLGWQRADFTEEADPYLDEIGELEVQQGGLANRRAGLAGDLAGLDDELSAEKERFKMRIDVCAADVEELRRQLVEVGEGQEIERKLASRFADAEEALQHELTATGEESARPLCVVEEELRDVGVQREKHAGTVEERSLAAGELKKELREAEQSLRKVKREQSDTVRKLTGRIRRRRRRKGVAEKTLHKLEKKKAAPYAVIGHMLADSGVAPANQPDALDDVEALRDAVWEIDCRIVESRAVSEATDREELMRFYLVCVAVGVFLALGLLIWIRRIVR